uniref:USP domain-containing protein n=1 Tax=Arcella intermedia TaxID=1963864 RepID=A0A6B2KX58_9EUKA
MVVSEKRWIESSIFSKSFKVEGKANDVDVQHDIDEYLDYLFRHLFSNLRGSSNPSLLNICFGVTLTNEIKSATKDVPYLSEKEEVFFKIPTDISTGSLKESLNSLMSPDQLEGESGMWSEEADKRINCTRRYRLTDLSNCIIFSLKRFEYVSGNRKKVNSKFSFPLSLNMKEWVEDSSRPGDYYEYELSGIIVHAGNSETGHYYSFIKQADDSGKMHWYRFDDVSVEPWNVKNIERDCFGGTEENKNACVLFYQRKQPSEVFWDETENIEGIPKRLYQEVQRENMALFQDRQYFNYTYSEFMLQMSWKLPTALVNYKRPNNSRNDPFTHFQILTRYLLEILIHSGEKSLFSRFVPVMRSIFNGNSDCARYFLLFTLKASGSEIHSTYPHDCNILKKVLLECKEEHLRISFVDLVVAALAVLSPREWKEKVWGKPKILKDETIYGTSLNPGDEMEGFSVCCQVMQSLFTMIDASRSVWPQFKQYFEIIRDFAMMDFYHRDYLREQFVIRELHDYFMNSRSGRPRAPIMDSDYFPDLRNFQEILEVILRGAKTERFPPNIEDDDFYRTPWSMPSRLNAQLHPHELSHLYDTKLFFHMIEMDYNYESMSRVVRHVCWNCEERSTKVVLTLVENIKSQVTEYKMMHIVPTKLNALLKTLHAVLSLNDTLKSQRIHWTLSPHKIHYESHHGITDTTGLLGVLRSEDKQVTQLMSFILYLALQNKTDLVSEPMHSVYSYLIHRRSEVYWMKDYLTSKIEASNEQLPKGISEKDYEVAVKELLDTPFINYPITPNALFAIVSKLCEESSMLDDIPPFWKTQEVTYLKQIEELKARIEREKAAIAELQESLANAQKNSRATYPDIPPPDENGVWKNGTKTATQQNQTVAGHRRATSDPIPETVVAESQAIVVAGPSPRVPPRPNHPIPVPMGTNPANPPVYGPHRPNSPVNSPSPSTEDPAEPNNAKSLIQKMKEIFSDYDEGLLKIALKAANWDTERAVDNMFDSNRVAEYQRQAHLGS